ncbi:hypothetical protein DESPIG_01965 [Desulfovibrio piger ATCC 29098]|uniref:Uncharacterized protein n=1 Tax=Desulfovibrio piger ATCC 29098 TaxID=411464 RepID=B6WV49_9BACT|nr:hypothetical protein DESPIG_01965 [Desulfovibrio piger ATCC 29098]
MPAAFCIVQRVRPFGPGRCRYTKAFPGALIKGGRIFSSEKIKRARETNSRRRVCF